MKKSMLLNADLSYVIATLGHTDMLVIADAGLPIPTETTRIDLALTKDIPRAEETLRVVLEEMVVEKAILAEEIKVNNPQFYQVVQMLLPSVPIEFLPHSQFKTLTCAARAVVRTGEFSPYANVILQSGVDF